jgi:hypothetical protein
VRRTIFCSLFLLAGLLLWPTVALAAGTDLAINCDDLKGKINTVNAALKLLDPAAVNILRISGTCRESITIDSFRRLTLAGNPTATIIATVDDLSAIHISNGSNVWLKDLSVEGAATAAVWCEVSLCQFSHLTVQNSDGDGILVQRGTALLEDIVASSNLVGLLGRGSSVRVLNGTFENNKWYGIQTDLGTNLQLAYSLSVRNNGKISGQSFAGIQSDQNSAVNLNGDGQPKVISGNSGPGITMTGGSVATILGTSFSGNGGGAEITVVNHSSAKVGGSTITAGDVAGHYAVALGDLSYVQFAGGNEVTGFISCGGQYSATRNNPLLNTANTNCLQ